MRNIVYLLILLGFMVSCDHSHVDVDKPEISVDPWTPPRPGVSTANDMVPMDLDPSRTGGGDDRNDNNPRPDAPAKRPPPFGDSNGQQPVPEPSTLILMGIGAAGIALIKKRKKKNDQLEL